MIPLNELCGWRLLRRHFEHHAKPNVTTKDPDISFPYLFLLGERLTRKWGQAKKGAYTSRYPSYLTNVALTL